MYLSTTVSNDFTDMNAALIEALITTARRLEDPLAGQAVPLEPLRLG